VWEIRVSVGPDPVTGLAVQHSVTVRGDLAQAERRRQLLAAQATALRERRRQPLRSVGELLVVWLAGEHDWKPSTWQCYRLGARSLATSGLAGRLPASVTPPVVRTATHRWAAAGIAPSSIALKVRILRAAFGWAFEERLIAGHPLQGMRGPAQPDPRRDVPPEVVRHLLQAAEDDVATALASTDSGGDRRVRQTRQVRLLLQLAADTGARRGELAALRLDDLHGRVLHIDRAVSAEVVTTTKTGRSRRLTVGMATVELWEQARAQALARQPAGLAGSPWLFAPDDGQGRLSCGALGHGFARFAREHGHGEVTLHRLRHTVATVLVANGQLLHAQQRLGHRDASTTLRQYCHALPLEDQDVPDTLHAAYRGSVGDAAIRRVGVDNPSVVR